MKRTNDREKERERQKEKGREMHEGCEGVSTPPDYVSPRLALVRLKADPLVRFSRSRDWLDTRYAGQSLAVARTMTGYKSSPFIPRSDQVRVTIPFFFPSLLLSLSGFYEIFFLDARTSCTQGKFNSRYSRYVS